MPVRNARADAVESAIGTAPTLEIRTSAPPADTEAADEGTLIAAIALPSDWMADAASGSKAKLGTWQTTNADGSGEVGHFRIKQGATTHMQGTCTQAGAGGDMTVDNKDIVAGQTVTVVTFTLNEPHA